MLVTVDKNDFVVSITPEYAESSAREISRSEAVPEATQVCKGPWHYHGGKGTPLPLSAFDMSRIHPNKRNSTCTECLVKSDKRTVEPAKRGAPVRSAASMPTPDTENGGLQYKWEVTYVTTTTMTVYAKTYTEAGANVGDVEVLGVRRLD